MSDICLVNMPYCAVERPSLALGLLQAVLKRDGIDAQSLYANLGFADMIGVRAYSRVNASRNEDGLGEWTFAHLAFPDFHPDRDAYVEGLIRRNIRFENLPSFELREIIDEIRAAAGRFVDETAERVLSTNPAIVGCTSLFFQHVPSLALLRRVRELSPSTVTVLGGGNCETIMGRTTHASFPWVDYVVSGEADGLVTDLVRALLEHGREAPVEALAAGVFAPTHRSIGYPRADQVGDGVPRAITPSLTGLPVPDYEDYFAELARLPELSALVKPGLTVESSRGCWWGAHRLCTFCGLNGAGLEFRSKPAEQLIDELDVLSARHGIDNFETTDNLIDQSYLKTFARRLRDEGSPYRLFYEVRASLKRRQVEALRAAGVIWVQPGVESLHTRVLDLMDKGTQGWQNVQFLKWCGQFGVRTGWNMLNGFPDEDDAWYAEMAEWIPLVTHLQPPGGMPIVRFDRYSRHHTEPETYGLRLMPAELYEYIYPLAPAELADQAYFFEDAERQELRKNPTLAALMTGDGIAATRRQVKLWMALWKGGPPPELVMEETSGSLRVRDTRPAATAPEHILEGLQRDVVLACDDAPRRTALPELLADVDAEALEAAVGDLIARRLILAFDDRLVGLPLRDPVPSLPTMMEFPGGTIDVAELERRERAAEPVAVAP